MLVTLINTSKYTNHTKEEISIYLDIVKKSVADNNFFVCTTSKNEKNRKFIEEYKLNKSTQKKMLLELQVEDFCYSADNYNNPQEKLYFFCREYELNSWGTIENVEVYIKIARKRDDLVVIVSFHKPEKKIKKLFL